LETLNKTKSFDKIIEKDMIIKKQEEQLLQKDKKIERLKLILIILIILIYIYIYNGL